MSMTPYRAGDITVSSEDEEHARNALSRDLAPHERILWAGRPRRGLRLGRADFALVPFSMIWAGLAVAWEVTAIFSGAPLLFPLFGIPFVLIGLYLVVGRFFVDARTRARTFYALTDRRALVVVEGNRRKLVSVELSHTTEVTLDEARSGHGTIVFGAAPGATFMANTSWPQKAGPPAFRNVPEVARAFRVVRDIQTKA